MTTRYQKRHYEDVARLLSLTAGDIADDKQATLESTRAGARFGGVQLGNIVASFADLFAADNPRRCERCAAPFPRSEGKVCTSARFGTPGDHQFSGFDRERFLAACGLKSEG